VRRRAGAASDGPWTAVQGSGMVCDRLRPEGRVKLELNGCSRDQKASREQSRTDGGSSVLLDSGAGTGERIERDEEVGRAA
jgi:hypothetical protein